MNINADFTQKAVVNTQEAPWLPSPMAGVNRKPLDRIGDEVAIATTIVSYAPNSSFPKHFHAAGEEILVLEGTFSDESGDYSAGMYLRNPPNSSHTPYSKEGCTIFVKLRQFHPDDSATIRIDTKNTAWYPGLVPGLSVMPLHEFDGVGTALVRWAPNTVFNPHVHPGGEEILVLEGVFHTAPTNHSRNQRVRSSMSKLGTSITS
jgi:anti-sigma factor ChrR (cupin superfamily)